MSKLTTCVTCSEPFLSELPKCPKCGADNPLYVAPDSTLMMLVQLVPIMVFALIVAIFGAGIGARSGVSHAWWRVIGAPLGAAIGWLISLLTRWWGRNRRAQP